EVKMLTDFSREMWFTVKIFDQMPLRGEAVSSSQTRRLLQTGHVSRARHLLGRPFAILSTPGRGRGYGSKYTVPTINLDRYDELAPEDGVYITRTRIGEQSFDCVTNIGNHPTFGPDPY